MKGFVFTEFLDLVETKYGFKVLQSMIKRANLPNDGIYASGGYYPFKEMDDLVHALSSETNIPVPELYFMYGRHLFTMLMKSFPHFAKGKNTPIEFMATVDNYIHVEVRKLYPNVELPTFDTESQTEDTIVLIYESKRNMEPFAKGMMFGCADYYNAVIDVQYAPTDKPNVSRFVVKHLKEAVPENLEAIDKKVTLSFLKRLFG